MRKIILFILLLYLGGLIVSNAIDTVEENTFKLSSKELKHNDTLPHAQVLNAHGCDGGNVSPQLSWNNPPINTKSFALICHDPDAPKENGWYHWLVVNIPIKTREIAQGGKIENSLETITDFKTTGYGGACPPIGHGIHHYHFTIYALDVEKLNVKANDNPVEVEKLVLKHTLAKSTITGLFERK
ncbi:MAG: YbhB/YbcL family Raf kinase inhibitor-like protein [Candidatus Gastranaerophilales bacterium]|nr:YbhB/YbcL family Raf kinase inhibitor-like protein [Candidatus Gastranaerophilales bacterium]